MHRKQLASMGQAVTGVLHAGSLGIAAIGRALAQAEGLVPKHAIKQVDRLLSNDKMPLEAWFTQWVPYALGGRHEALLAMDWTEFRADGHSTLCIYLVNRHGRATPLYWRTFAQAELVDGGRTDSEDVALMGLRPLLPADVRVTLLADRGFADRELYELLDRWGWQFVVRMRKNTYVTRTDGERRPVQAFLHPAGKAIKLIRPTVTEHDYSLGAVVTVHAKKMQEPWFLASNMSDLNATQLIKLYGRRFTIEETFRDQKDPRFGLGMNHVRVKSPQRRDRLFFLATIAQALLTLLGAAGEKAGLDRELKANTAKTRTLSLFRQGTFWFQALPNMKPAKSTLLLKAFGQLILEHFAFKYALGVL